MKAFMFIVTVSLSSAALAQEKQYFQPNYERYNSIVKPVPPAYFNHPLLKRASMQADTAQYAGSNNLGDIYFLPQDNMPMLKPFINGTAAMPITDVSEADNGQNKQGKMPNAIKRKKMVLPAPPAF